MTTPPASPELKVLVFAASLRADSLNAKLAELAATVAESQGAVVDRASLRNFDVPLYDGDLEADGGIPAGADAFRQRLVDNDAFSLASPEYNASMPGTVMNLIDWTSRFRPHPFNGSHGLLLSASPSLAGGNRGLWALRMPLEHLGARIFPEMFSLAMAHKAFADGRLADAGLQGRFEKTIQGFLELAEAASHYPCIKRAWVEFPGEPPGAGVDRVDPAEADAAAAE